MINNLKNSLQTLGIQYKNEEINLSRRGFLTKATTILGGTALGFVSPEALANPKESYEKSLTSAGKNEVDFFIRFFGLTNNYQVYGNDFYSAFDFLVKDFQKKYGLGVDGVIGTKTLEKLYFNNYVHYFDQLPMEMQSRLKFFDEIQKYYTRKGNPNGKRLSGLKSAFDASYYYGRNGKNGSISHNIPGTFINSELYGKIPQTHNYNHGNSIQIFKFSGRMIKALYVNGNLKVATYTSPGVYNHKSPQNDEYSVDFLKKYYISGTYPKAIYSGKGRLIKESGGAVLPFAYEIKSSSGIYGHVGETDGTPHSHGCFRVPGFYQQAIFNELKAHGPKKFKVKIDNLY